TTSTLPPTTRRVVLVTSTTQRPRRGGNRVASHSASVDSSSPPIIISDDDNVDCNKRGVFPYPGNCGKFVVCSPSSKAASGLRGFVNSCPADSIYNKSNGRCMKGSRQTCEFTGK